MATSMDVNFRRALDKFKVDNLRDFQKQAVQSLLKGRDVYLSVKTGGGKSLTYQIFPDIWRSMNEERPCQVLIVTPLISIMKEQCTYLTALGFKATYIGKDDSEQSDILNGQFDFLFASPESLLGTAMWRDMLRNDNSIRLLVVDEAHTVLHWGESEGDHGPFRSWYGKLGEARSLLVCPILLITATANQSARKQMQKKFSMVDCLEIIDNPDRNNIKFFVHKYKSTLPLSQVLSFILKSVKQDKDNCSRHIIFCPSIKLCSEVYTMFRLELGIYIKHVEMFHSMTTDEIKEEVRMDMNLEQGKIRVLVATSAAGMGLNFVGVNSVVNIGPPKDMDSFVQQFGRSGRDGSQAMALLLFSPKQCKNLDKDMCDYISNDTICRRKVILSSYNAEPLNTCKHLCCDICSRTCCCQRDDCTNFDHPFFSSDLPSCESSSESDVCDSELV